MVDGRCWPSVCRTDAVSDMFSFQFIESRRCLLHFFGGFFWARYFCDSISISSRLKGCQYKLIKNTIFCQLVHVNVGEEASNRSIHSTPVTARLQLPVMMVVIVD